jgi:predicted nucleic acid-binding protein
MSRPVALLDANVLYPARLRDLLIRLAIAGLYQARWSDRILDECFDNLIADRPDLPAGQITRTRRLMTTALPDAAVVRYEHLVEEHDLPDPDDNHVLAAAQAADATLVVTGNGKDFPSDKLPSGLQVVSPDEFVLALVGEDLDTVAEVIEAQAAALVNPPMTSSQLLDGLEEVGLVTSVAHVRAAIG